MYGVILLVAGIVGSTESKNKAAGVNINLWAGIVLLLMATFFLVWALTRPLSEEMDEADGGGQGERPGRPETAPPEEPR